MTRKTSAILRTVPRALLRALVGATAGGALSALVALAGYGLARERYGTHDPGAFEMSALGGAVMLALPGALAVVRMYSDRERWTSAALTLTLFPGAALGAIGGVAAFVLGWGVSWVLRAADMSSPAQTWSHLVLGGAILGTVLGVAGLPRPRRSRARPSRPRRRGASRRRK
jgi:hypothetical protein